MITELWATPVFTTVFQNHEEITKELMKVKTNPTQKDLGPMQNVYDKFHPSEVLDRFSKGIVAIGNDFMSKYEGGEVEIKRGWYNTQRFGESIRPHVHHNTALSVVYYMTAPDYCGDLLLFDPRNGARWWDKGGEIFHRIKPKEGMFLMFPGYLAHVTEQNRNPEPRISFVTNLGMTS